MKTLRLLLLSVLSSSPLLYAQPADFPGLAAGPTPTLDEMVKSVFAAREQVRPLAASPGYGFDYTMLLPILVNAQGKFGARFIADYFINNDRPTNQDVVFGWITPGISNVGASTMRATLTPNSITPILDFVSVLGKTGVGSLMITCVLPGSNTVDTNGLIYGAALIYTKDPTTGGVNSFSSPGLSPSLVHGPNDSIIVGVRQNDEFRTNYGVINLDTVNSHTFQVNFLSTTVTPTTLTLPPLSMQYLAAPSIPATSSGYFAIDVRPISSLDFRWYSFGIGAHNVSGDGWFSAGIQFRF